MADGYFARPVLASATKSSKIYQIAVPKGPGLQIRWESELAAVGMEGERVAPNSVYPLPDVAVTPAKVRLSVD